MRLTHLLGVGTAAVALAIAGCGGGGGDSDEDQIRAAIEEVSETPSALCDYLSQDLIELVGDEEECRDLAEQSGADDEGGTDVEIVSVEVDGDNATARVKPEDGEEEDVTFVKEDDKWVFATPPGSEADAATAEAPEVETATLETETTP